MKSTGSVEPTAVQPRLPFVDIIIAARNEARYIGACLDALTVQNYPADRLRIHVIDNGSTDATARIADKRGVTVSHAEKRGAAAARNTGLAQTSGELVGFLDAHCIVDKNWVRVLSEAFRSDDVGGAQGLIENKAVNTRVQQYLDSSGALSNQRVVEDTVSGKRNIYPWILSGSSMYRRTAINEAGLFEENLQACEDVDLAWRVVLLGYQLNYVAEARLVHINCDTWRTFVSKGMKYGEGAATLAAMYNPHGAREKFTPAQIWSTKPEKLLSGICYWAGYRRKELRLRVGLDKVPREQAKGSVLARFRIPFEWTSGGVSLRISENAVFWFRDDDQTSVIVQIPTGVRVVLDSVGNFIWHQLARGLSREAIIGKVTEHFGVASVTASTDLDEFVEELIEAGILVRDSREAD